MMSEGVVNQFTAKSNLGHDWSTDMSRERRYMAFPRTNTIFRNQWKNCMEHNRANVVVFDDGGVSVVSTMYPQDWNHPDKMSGFKETPMVRHGKSANLGNKGLTKCICHAWSRHLMGTMAHTEGYELVGQVEVNADI